MGNGRRPGSEKLIDKSREIPYYYLAGVLRDGNP